MPRQEFFYQAANAAYGISGGSGSGTSASPAAWNFNDFVSKLNNNYDIYINRGGRISPGTVNTTDFWFGNSYYGVIVANPSNLSRVFAWDGLSNSGLGRDLAMLDSGFYDPPTLSGDSGGWTSIGNGQWTKPFSFTTSTTLLAIYAQSVAGVGLETVRLELCKRSSAVNCVRIGDWYCADSTSTPTITMYTGGNTTDFSPSRVFGGLSLFGNTSRWASALGLYRSSRIEWHPSFLSMHGGLFINNETATGVSSDMLFDGYESRYSASYNVRIRTSNSTTTGGVYRLQFKNCVLASDTRPEANQVDWATIQNGIGVQHSFSAFGKIGDVSLADSVLQGGRHGCYEIQMDTALSAGERNWPRNMSFYGTRAGLSRCEMPGEGDALYNGYFRGLAIGSEGGWFIDNITITGQTTRSQLSGRGRLTRCHMSRFGRNLSAGSPDDNGGTDGALSFNNNGSGTQECKGLDVTVENNIIDSPYNYPMRVAFQYSDIFPAGALKFQFNTIIDLAHFNERKIDRQTTIGKTAETLTSASSGSVFISNSSGGAPGYLSVQYFQNNLYIAPNNGIFVDATQASGGGTSGTGITISNSVNGTFAEGAYTASGQMQFVSKSAAGINDDNVPDIGSPVIYAANNNTPRLDNLGNLRHIPPSVGAIDYAG